MTKDEVLKLALEALEQWDDPFYKRGKAITAIKEALAQPEEEPLHPVHIGVDVTREGTAVTAFYRKPDAVMEMFYSQFHPLAQPEQEPVAWLIWLHGPAGHFDHKQFAEMEFERRNKEYPDPDRKLLPLYTTPPQRTWVGLTSVDWNDFNAVKSNDPQYVAAWAEAKLRSKNT